MSRPPQNRSSRHGYARGAVRSPYTQILGAEGKLNAPLPPFATDPEELRSLYREMVLLRAFDRKAVALQRTGRLGTYASCLGQEAVGVGIGRAMAREDVLLGTYRENGAMLHAASRWTRSCSTGAATSAAWTTRAARAARGLPDLRAGRARMRRTPPASPMRSSCGASRASRSASSATARPPRATSTRRMNVAGVWQLPVVFVIVQQPVGDLGAAHAADGAPRRWRRRPSRRASPASRSTATTSSPCGTVLERALDKARRGGGPRVIEVLTYRLGDHTTADDARRYRDRDRGRRRQLERPHRAAAELPAAPSALDRGRRGTSLAGRQRGEVERAVSEYLAVAAAPPRVDVRALYAELPAALARAAAIRWRRRRAHELRSRWSRPSTWRSHTSCRRTRASSCSARTSASTAACSAPPRACSSASAPSA